VLDEVGSPSRQNPVGLDELSEGDELKFDVLTSEGLLLAAANSHVSDYMIRRFRDIQNNIGESLSFHIK
jgi:hypothetical protein